MRHITKNDPQNGGGYYPWVDATDNVITMQRNKPFDGWILKTINPGDDCFYVEGDYQTGTRTDLTSDAITAQFEAPADSVFYSSNSTSNNANIKSIVQWPKGITSLGSYCFYKCSGLTSITIPDGMTQLGDYCFNNCSGLTSITIPDGVTSLGNYCFLRCSSLTSIDLPAGLTSLSYRCFYNCSSLTFITIPGSVAYLGGSCFSYCSGLTSITFNGITEPTNGYNAFYNTPDSLVIHVPSNYQGDTFVGRTVTKDLPAV